MMSSKIFKRPILLALNWIPETVSSLGSYAVILFAFLLLQKLTRLARENNGVLRREVVHFER